MYYSITKAMNATSLQVYCKVVMLINFILKMEIWKERFKIWYSLLNHVSTIERILSLPSSCLDFFYIFEHGKTTQYKHVDKDASP